jgi:thiol-disulfide isomerase/thioredoxin
MQKAMIVLLLFSLVGCGGELPTSESEESVVGTWRAVLASPGGDLPFALRVTEAEGQLRAVVVNGEEEVELSSVEVTGDRYAFHFASYDSEITVSFADDSRFVLNGTWRKTAPERDSTLAFTAHRALAQTPRFLPLAEAGLEAVDPAPAAIGGNWAVLFTDDDGGTEPARAELHQEGTRVDGTVLTPTGDYRYLEGSYDSGVLRLSTFDGAHAFLFVARAQADGTLQGDFWSRDTYHASWTARTLGDDETVLPDAWSAVGLTNDDGSFAFAFPDIEGNVVSSGDERFAGKVVLVNVFGTWCPNCNDEAPLLVRFDHDYRDRGLEVVGLAYEFTGNPERDREMLRRFKDRYALDYTLLLAGTSDKAKAGETLPDLTAVLSFPTTIFIGRDGRVRRIHSGFSGPGTGGHYEQLVTEMEGLVEELLDES